MAKQNNEKSAIMAVLVFIGFVVMVYACYKFTAMASLGILVILTVLAEELLIIPSVNKLYHEYHDMEAPVARWVPIYNEIMLFSGWVYTASIILTILLAIAGLLASPLLTYLPFSVVVAVRITTYALYAAIALILALCVVRGVGFCSIKREADMSILDVFDKAPGPVGYFLYVTMFFPLIRAIGMAYLLSDLKRLSLNDISSDFEAVDDDEDELYEE